VLCNGLMTLRSSLGRLLIAVFVLLSSATGLAAQGPSAPGPSETSAEQSTAPPEAGVSPRAPQAAVRAFITAVYDGRLDDAARYLSLTPELEARGPELAERLVAVIDSARLIDLEALSAAADGSTDDDLPADREEVATVPTRAGDEPMRLIRVSGVPEIWWAFSPATVARIDDWYAALPHRWVRDLFSGGRLEVMLERGPFGILWWQWLAIPLVVLLSWGTGRLLRELAWPMLARATSKTDNQWDDRIVASIGPPVTLALAVGVAAISIAWLRLPPSTNDLATILLRASLVVSLFWGMWRSSAVFMAWSMGRPWAIESPSARNLLLIGSSVVRGAIVGVGILALIAAVGYPVGTVLAGLGIGGLALAFGAQKTVENLFGSVALAIDQPFRVGDFVKIEDFVGTVEDVGLRSTRIRTLDRTLISIPNGKLADQRLESFQVRDRMRLATTIGVTYDTTRDQLRQVIEGFERVLRSHPKVWPDAVVVKFKEFGASSLDIEIMAWFDVPDWGAFQQCRQEVLLDFMGVVEQAGSSFAFPTRTVHLVNPAAAPA
jgi:MscS family membrane protein